MRRRLSLLCAIALVAGLAVGLAPQASAVTNYRVAVSKFFAGGANGPFSESMRFFPEDIDVHTGDVIKFDINSFHTATLLPEGEDPDAWLAANYTGLDKPFSLMNSDPDDGARATKFNFNAFGRSDPGCGAADNPCPVDGSDVVNSGAPFGQSLSKFSVEITAPAGSDIPVLCLIHPSMRMTIHVVNEGAPASTQDDIDAERKALFAEDSALATETHEGFERTFTDNGDGTRTWDAYSGIDVDNISLFGMYPRRLKLDKGDTVRWHFEELIHETHTSSMPVKRARKVSSRDGTPACDPDGDAGPGPDQPPSQDPQGPFGLGCDAGQELEFDRSTKMVVGAGNGIVTGRKDFESSGERGPWTPVPPTAGATPYDLTFNRRSHGTAFEYLCQVHPFMRGKVAVK